MATKTNEHDERLLANLARRRGYLRHLERTKPGDPRTLAEADGLAADERRYRAREEFKAALGVEEIKWSGRNVSRLLRSTGERPDRVEEIRAILEALGLGNIKGWPGKGGVFDHGTSWGRRTKIGPRSSLVPFALVGHPYDIDADERGLLTELAKYPTLRVAVDDRPSFYGFRTHHVRISVPEPRKPFDADVSTAKTRRAARAARHAFLAEGLPLEPT